MMFFFVPSSNDTNAANTNTSTSNETNATSTNTTTSPGTSSLVRVDMPSIKIVLVLVPVLLYY